MNQQDYTAPLYPVRQSIKEAYQDVFQLMQVDGLTPDTSLSGAVVQIDLYADKTQQRLGQGHYSWVSTNAVQVSLTQQQVGRLTRGRYRLEVSVTQAGNREELVHIILELV
ncbi:MAG: hypothetical protein EOO39_16290 [Cytophagaceae bacterium]|nr:MAG: hypothetical protein EOO39_16290 [Cytophagaceae bacterium]